MELSGQIRRIIDGFLQERLQPKLDKLREGDEEKRRKLVRDFTPERWIADAARRVCQIQRVTHALKFSHPEAKGSSLYSVGNRRAPAAVVGSHALKTVRPDVVRNAAALDVYKFLRLAVNGETLLQLAQRRDPALTKAFSGDHRQAEEWVSAFASLDTPKGKPATHKLAKQLYWPLHGGGYHLLGPLFPSSLVHAQYEQLRHYRFSDQAKLAREARFKNIVHSQGYREYPGLVIIKFGGTKPQNISQLNSERHGEAWLLPALPPEWTTSGLKPPCHVDSIFGRWLTGFGRVRGPVNALRDFLQRTEHNNLGIRRQRARLTQQVIDEVLNIAAHVRQLKAGWSADSNCLLNQWEKFWLDPGRTKIDEDFSVQRGGSDWQAHVVAAFGRWLNGFIDSNKTPMSDPEREHWGTVLQNELKLVREEIADE